MSTHLLFDLGEIVGGYIRLPSDLVVDANEEDEEKDEDWKEHEYGYLDNNWKKDGPWLEYYLDDNNKPVIISLRTYQNGLLEGETDLFGERGNIQRADQCVAGELNGPSSLYHPDGSIYFTIDFVDGKLNGPMIEYYEDGSVESISHHVDDILDGELVTFRPDGIIDSVGEYVDGKYINETKYDRRGHRLSTSNFRNDRRHGEYVEYSRDGTVKSVSQYENGRVVEFFD